MVSLSRSQKAAFDNAISAEPPAEIIISKIFHHSFELVAEVLTIISGSPQRAESAVASNLVDMASPKLTDEPGQNLSRLRAASIETMELEWIPSPTFSELRHSPLALLRSLSYPQAVAFVLHNFSRLSTVEIAVALGLNEAGVKMHLGKATEAVKLRLNQPKRDLASVFNAEAEILANQVFADPEILVQILLELATKKSEPAPTPRKSLRRLRE
jgi:DNA-directed RNA polymerase specialized sigma24 family protein